MKRFGLLALVLVFGAVAPTAHAGGDAKTKVTLDDAFSPSLGGDTFYEGTVSSPEKSCAKNRKVSVYMKGPGKDQKIANGVASEKSKVSGTWIYDARQSDPPMAGYYYSKAKAIDGCEADHSKDFLFARKSAKREGDLTKTKLNVSISYFPETQTRQYAGFVKSDKASCKKGRTVTFFEIFGDAKEKIGSGETNEQGAVFVTDSPAPPFGNEQFVAKVKKTSKCSAAKRSFQTGTV